jgi:hypothetical protein
MPSTKNIGTNKAGKKVMGAMKKRNISPFPCLGVHLILVRNHPSINTHKQEIHVQNFNEERY